MEQDSIRKRKDCYPYIDKKCEVGLMSPCERLNETFHVRLQAAKYQRNIPLAVQLCNGDKKTFSWENC